MENIFAFVSINLATSTRVIIISVATRAYKRILCREKYLLVFRLIG